jgi:hypothetical protein
MVAKFLTVLLLLMLSGFSISCAQAGNAVTFFNKATRSCLSHSFSAHVRFFTIFAAFRPLTTTRHY